jgi:hypothetical protein
METLFETVSGVAYLYRSNLNHAQAVSQSGRSVG